MHGACRCGVFVIAGIILCVSTVSAAPARHQTQVTARKRIFCNFVGCGSKRSQPSPMDESYRLLQRLQNDDSAPARFNRDLADFDDEAAEQINSATKLGYDSPSRPSDERNLYALHALQEIARDRKLLQEAAMWEVLLDKLREEKSSHTEN